MLSGDYVKLVLIALLVAGPLGGYIMQKWLSGFAYHATLSIWIFVIAGFIAIAVALLTVSLQSVRAALRNPVQSLKSE
jgi:putative ABC transport system permease protein